ncbi:lectin-like isoform X1 [Leucoraja erinacea]|uniref:lectin-like isoform X1 n=1 Tax=Leucoraja erinaceus TaxID=7782 RepID=UPI0024561535|nr:lectin-like isoform X1 [Leucoraja erinacea]
MMLVWVLVLTALLASDVAGTSNSLGLEETQHHIEKRNIGKQDCENDWVYYPPLKSCFRFFCHNRTWANAEEFCKHQPHSAHLASVSSRVHNIFLKKMIAAESNGNLKIWIGLNDILREGTLVWVDGSTHIYRHWLQGEPNNHGGHQDCVIINNDDGGFWSDRPCLEMAPFICSYH